MRLPRQCAPAGKRLPLVDGDGAGANHRAGRFAARNERNPAQRAGGRGRRRLGVGAGAPGRAAPRAAAPAAQRPAAPAPAKGGFDDMDDDIPF